MALGLLGLPLLDECTEGGQASAKAGHEDVCHLVVGDLHHRVRGVADAEIARSEEGHEAGAQTELGHIAFGLPILPHDEQLALAGAHGRGRADGVDALLDRGHQLHVLVGGDLQGLELGQVVRIGAGARLLILELFGLAIQGELRNRHLLHNVHGIWYQLLKELARGLAEEVQVLREQLLDRCQHHHALLFLRRELHGRHDLKGVQAHQL
mmetsp:Transcript_10508/g.29384  ORF Transcript_10508/g.29384 Transcript_10508/m.29384 type:complete len:210 (+) Transcript_10508:622-1251(+)